MPSCRYLTPAVSVRAWPKALLLLLLLFRRVSDSCGTFLTWILTASLVPPGLWDVWVLNCLKVTFILLFFFCGHLACVPHWVPKGSCHRLSTGRRFFRLPSLNTHRKIFKQMMFLSCAKVCRIWALHLWCDLMRTMVCVEKLGCFFTINSDFELPRETEFLQVFSLSLCHKTTYTFIFYFSKKYWSLNLQLWSLNLQLKHIYN